MESVEKGKKIVIAMIVVVLLVDILTMVGVSMVYAKVGYGSMIAAELTKGCIRFIISALILFFLYKGHKWAKWVIAVLMILAGLFSVLAMVASLNLLILALGVIYAAFGILLITNKPVNDFLNFQRGIEPDYEKPKDIDDLDNF